jgi:hypothetical protein
MPRLPAWNVHRHGRQSVALSLSKFPNTSRNSLEQLTLSGRKSRHSYVERCLRPNHPVIFTEVAESLTMFADSIEAIQSDIFNNL